MRKSETQPLSQVIKDYTDALKISGKLKETRLLAQWEEIIGTAVARRTQKIFIKDSVLYIYLASSVVRNELMMIKESLLAKMNEKAGESLIKKIVIR